MSSSQTKSQFFNDIKSCLTNYSSNSLGCEIISDMSLIGDIDIKIIGVNDCCMT